MKMQQWLPFSLLPIAILIAGCGGGGSSAPGSSVAPPTSNGPASLGHMVISIPNASSSSVAKRPMGISPAAASISITVTGITAAQIADISATSPNCTSGASGRNCTIPVQASPGNDVFTVTIFDGPNATGHQLGTGTANSSVTPGSPFSVNITLAGVIASLQFVVDNKSGGGGGSGSCGASAGTGTGTPTPGPSPSPGNCSDSSSVGPPIGKPGSVIGTVAAKDASGNYIIGPYNAPVSITSTNPSVSASPATINGSDPVTFSYDGVATQPVTLTATSGSIVTTQTVNPSSNIIYYPTPTINATWIVAGPDGNLYISEFGPEGFFPGGTVGSIGPGKIARFDPVAKAFTGEVTVGQSPVGMAFAPDGSFFNANQLDDTIKHVSGFSTVTSATVPTLGSRPRNIVLGAEGNMWFTEVRGGSPSTARIARFSPASPSSITEYVLPAGSRAQGLASGPDGNLYVTDANNGAVYQVSTAGAVLNAYSIPGAVPGQFTVFPRFITAGSDGNMWLSDIGAQTNYSPGNLWKLTTGGTYTKIIPPLPYAAPDSVHQGPGGILYFADLSGLIGEVVESTGVVTEFPIVRGCNSADGIGPNDVAIAPDGTLWFVGPNCGTATNPNNPASYLGHLVLGSGWTAFPLTNSIALAPTGGPATNTQLIGIAEAGDSSPFTVTSANPGVATVSATASSHDFLITGAGVGTTTITITDKNSQIITKNVIVTSASGTISSTGRRIP